MGVKAAKHIYLLRLTRSEDGHFRATLRVRGKDREMHFASIEALTRYLQSLEVPYKPRGLR